MNVIPTNPQQLESFQKHTKSNDTQLIERIIAQDIEKLYENIENYEIDFSTEKGQLILTKMLDAGIKNYSMQALSRNIKKFKIRSENTRIMIAKIVAIHDPRALCENIENYEIDSSTEKGQKTLEEIIEIMLQAGHMPPLVRNIKKFKIQSEKIRIKLAKIAAKKEPVLLCKHIEDYEIDSRQERVEIAKITAVNNAGAISSCIQNFEIYSSIKKGQEDLIEIAKLAAAKDAGWTSFYIKNYRINPKTEEGKKGLVAIAKIAVVNGGQWTSSCIKNYGIDPHTKEGQKDLVEIAKLAAINDGENLSLYIEQYEIDRQTKEGQQALIEIAMLAVAENGEQTSRYIQNYGIDSAEALIEIAKQAVTRSSWSALIHIKNYGIDVTTEQGLKTFLDLVAITLKQVTCMQSFTYDEFQEFSEKFSKELITLFDFNKVGPFLQLYEEKESLDHVFYKFKNLCEKELDLESPFMDWLIGSYSQIKTNYEKGCFLEWTIGVTVVFLVCDQVDHLIKCVPFLHSIKKSPSWLEELLIKELLDFYVDLNIERQNTLQLFRNKCKETKIRKKINPIPVHIEAPSLIFAGYPIETRNACLKAIKKIKDERDFFRQQSTKKIMLETLIKIKNSRISPEAKRCLIKQLFGLNRKEFIVACKYVRDLINFKEFSYLEHLQITEKGIIKDLENSLSNFFNRTFEAHIENFGEKYAKTFETWRNRECLMTFAGKMNSLVFHEKEIAIKLLNEFVACILNDNFQSKRYETKQNPHLAFIKKKAPEVFEKWQNNLSLDSLEIASIDKNEKISLYKAIKNQIFRGILHEHLGKKEHYPHIMMVINDPSQPVSGILTMILSDLDLLKKKRLASDDKKMSKEDIELKRRLLIEKSILELLTTHQTNELEKKLKILINKLPKNNVFRQTDLAACLKLFVTEDSNQIDFNVIESDHPNDCLLSGTEIEGSCQSIHGSPNLNKCLLAYALDGKHKLLLIIDSQGRILARAVIRLLIDGNHKPILFLEKVYTSYSHPLFVPNLIKLALKKARHLGVPLVTTDYGLNKNLCPFHTYVMAKEKPVPFEYVDSLQKIEEEAYSISPVYELIS